MTTDRKRPAGVTLIALLVLWTGCIGALVFPIIGLSGGTAFLWEQIFGRRIQSVAWMRVISFALDGLWFLLYVASAIFGFGLWKLKNWARQAMLASIVVGISAGILVSIVFVRPVFLAISALGGIVVELAWIAWYLKRPRVRHAFGAWKRYSAAGEWIEPPELTKRGKQGVGILAVASLGLLFVVPLFVGVNAMMKSSDAYKLTISTAQASPCIVSSLGSPVEPGWIVTGGIQESDNGGSANLSIPVSGPKGKGSLDVRAKKLGGSWRIDSLVFTDGASPLSIIPSDSTRVCK